MNFFSINKNTILVIAFLSLLIGSSAIIQIKYDEIENPQIIFTTETKYILPTFIVKNFSFGFSNIIADLYWVKAIQDFSIWDGKDSFYLQEYKNIAALDPKFSYPYLLGILTFTSKSVGGAVLDPHILETIEPVSQIGIKNLPENWEIPFYLGTGFQLTKNPEKALYYLKIAADNPDAPERIRNVYKSYLKNAIFGDVAAREFIKAIYDTTSSETTKKILEDGIMTNDLKEIIESIANNYKIKYSVYPTSIDDLVYTKMIQIRPELKKEFNITINKNTGEVSITPKNLYK